MATPSVGLNPLVDKIRTAHPGAYNDMDDAELTKRVLAKYPQYSDLAAPPVQPPAILAPPGSPRSLVQPADKLPEDRAITAIGAKVASDAPEFLKSAVTPMHVGLGTQLVGESKRFMDAVHGNDTGAATSVPDFFKKAIGTTAGAAGIDTSKVGEAVSNKDYPSAVAEIATPLAENYALGKAADLKPGLSAPEFEAEQVQSARQAMRPRDRNNQFAKNVETAHPAVQEELAKRPEAPASMEDWNDVFKSAKSNLWQQYEALLAQGSKFHGKVKALLNAAPGEIDTGVQQVKPTDTPGQLIDAEGRDFVRPAEPTPESAPEALSSRIAAMNAKKDVGSMASSIPDRIFGPPNQHVDTLGPQASVVPRRVLSPTTEEGTQFLSGGAHPEMSGELTNPATLITRDPVQIKATLNRLQGVANAPGFSAYSPSEQTMIRGQIDRLSSLVQPGEAPKNYHGPMIDGNKIADAIVGSIDKRSSLKYPGQADTIRSFADTYRRPLSPQEAEKFLEYANRESKSYFEASRQDPHQAPSMQANLAEGDALRSSLYSLLDNIEPGKAAQLKRTYGSLASLQDYLQKRLPVTERQSPINLQQSINRPLAALQFAKGHPVAGALQYGLSEYSKHLNDPMTQMNQAFSPKSPGAVNSFFLPGTIGAASRTGVDLETLKKAAQLAAQNLQ